MRKAGSHGERYSHRGLVPGFLLTLPRPRRHTTMKQTPPTCEPQERTGWQISRSAARIFCSSRLSLWSSLMREQVRR